MRILVAAVAALIVVAGGCDRVGEEKEPGRSDARVLVVGIDGATWDVILPMFEAGELPNLRKLYNNGVRGVLESRPPVLSPVVWTTMFTGRPHKEHGVENWKTSQTQHRKVTVLWEITSREGFLTHVLNVPGSWPPEPVTGVMMSGFPLPGSTFAGNTGYVVTVADLERGRVPMPYRGSPKVISESIAELPVGEWSDWIKVSVQRRPDWRGIVRAKRLAEDRYYLSPLYRVDPGLKVSHPADLRARVARRVGEQYIPEGPGWSKHGDPDTPDYLYDHLRQISEVQSRAANLFASDDWDLFIYVMTLVDRVSHPYWAYSDPDSYDEEIDRDKAARYAHVVADSYRESDRHLGELLSAAEGEYYVVIVSDHGFHASKNKAMYIGTHDYDGVYLISGPGIEGKDGERAMIEDVGPTVLHLMGMPVADDMAGVVMGDLVATLGREPEQIASYEVELREGTDVPVDDETWEQLRGLGYVDGAPPRQKKTAPGAQQPAKRSAVKQPAARQAPARPPVRAVRKGTAQQKPTKSPAAPLSPAARQRAAEQQREAATP